MSTNRSSIKWHTRPRRSTKLAALASCALLVLGPLALALGHPIVGRTLDSYGNVPTRPFYVPAPSPIVTSALGLLPTATDAHMGEPSPSIRAIEVEPQGIQLVDGGKIVRTISGTGPLTSLSAIRRSVDQANWISQAAGGEFTLRAALIFESGTRATLAAPQVTQIRMVDLPGVFLGLNSADVTIRGVAVSAVGVPSFRDDEPPYRPFVVADGGSTLNVVASSFTGLGYDWNSSYGVSWMSSTGRAIDSTFEHNFIGAYTEEAQGLTFSGDVFAHNFVYGLDPHTYSSDLLVTHNRAFDNVRHGIIFSKFVTASTVSDNVSTHNGENGIMMDASSNGNVIEHNTVTNNRGDGIVLSGSKSERITGNVIEHNRVGVNVYGAGSASDYVRANTIASNVAPYQGLSSGTHNTIFDNGVRYRWILWWVAPVFGLVLMLMLASAGCSLVERRRAKGQAPGVRTSYNLSLQGGRSFD
ncbi:MAG TPA: right-handed parallel beta-helix repeat-containing protein [Acidimicrobiales bacterium]|nr:right-handed parallel beta-helix repeat-containing protein [Acidimicrobiales bacterium]